MCTNCIHISYTPLEKLSKPKSFPALFFCAACFFDSPIGLGSRGSRDWNLGWAFSVKKLAMAFSLIDRNEFKSKDATKMICTRSAIIGAVSPSVSIKYHKGFGGLWMWTLNKTLCFSAIKSNRETLQQSQKCHSPSRRKLMHLESETSALSWCRIIPTETARMKHKGVILLALYVPRLLA